MSGNGKKDDKEACPEIEPGPGKWGKLDILLRPVGGLATAAVVAYIGFLGSDVLQSRQQTNAKAQLYAQIMSTREQAETGLRREMFNSIIQTFLQSKDGADILPGETALNRRLLAVQLLTYNFHDALDIGPLFKYMERRAHESLAGDNDSLEENLEWMRRTARDVIAKQVAALESDGETDSQKFELINSRRGYPWIDGVLPRKVEEPADHGMWPFSSGNGTKDVNDHGGAIGLKQKHQPASPSLHRAGQRRRRAGPRGPPHPS